MSNLKRFAVPFLFAVLFLVCMAGFAGPIHQAAQKGDVSQVRKLLWEDATLINARDEKRRTPLHWAASTGNLKLAETLLEWGADVGSDAAKDLTPLRCAALGGHKDVVELLVSKGAYFDIISATILENTNRVAELLRDNSELIRMTNQAGQTPLHYASIYGNQAAVSLLLDGGADIEAKDQNGLTPLRWAVDMRRTEVIRMLMGKSAKMDFFTAVAIGDKDQVERCLQSDRTVIKARQESGSKGIDGMTALHLAAFKGHKTIVVLLLAEGADVNATEGGSRWTPLHWALHQNHEDVAEVLRQHGGHE